MRQRSAAAYSVTVLVIIYKSSPTGLPTSHIQSKRTPECLMTDNREQYSVNVTHTHTQRYPVVY